jgi:hypothetical protein
MLAAVNPAANIAANGLQVRLKDANPNDLGLEFSK